MITLPAKFEAENKQPENTPAWLVKLQEEVLTIEETSEVDWGNNTDEVNVDYTPDPPTSGDVVLKVGSLQNQTWNTWAVLNESWNYNPLSTSQGWQSFRQRSGGSLTLKQVKGYFAAPIYGGWVNCELWSASKGAKIGSTVGSISVGTSGVWITFDFSSQSLSISDDTEYWLKFYGTGNPGPQAGSLLQYYQNSNVFLDGQYDMTGDGAGTDLGDAVFEVEFTVDYQAKGTIQTDEMDVGVTPTNNGEWIFFDSEPGETSITYEAWASDTGVFGGEETSLGTVADGDAITVLKRYYLVKSTLTGDWDYTTEETPTLHSIGADFSSYLTYADTLALGYEPSIMSVSALSTMIKTFEKSSIGQITMTLGFTPSISAWLNSKYPKNKIVEVKAGFIADGWVESDYIDYFRGQVVDWSISSKDEVTLKIRDFSKEWSGVKVPAKWESAGDDVTWTAEHPVDVMLDLLEDYISVRESKIDKDSFNTVKAALSGWKVTRTITGNPEDAKKLMQELRLLTSTSFIPQSDGRIKLKLWDSSEAAVDSITDDGRLTLSYEGNADSLINHTLIYYDWDGDGNDASDFGSLEEGIDATSQANHDETSLKQIKDKWTAGAESAQITTLETNILDRFDNPRAEIKCSVDRKWIYLEVGDIVTLTTRRAPSADMAGITDVKFQIIRRELDFTKDTIGLTLLEV